MKDRLRLRPWPSAFGITIFFAVVAFKPLWFDINPLRDSSGNIQQVGSRLFYISCIATIAYWLLRHLYRLNMNTNLLLEETVWQSRLSVILELYVAFTTGVVTLFTLIIGVLAGLEFDKDFTVRTSAESVITALTAALVPILLMRLSHRLFRSKESKERLSAIQHEMALLKQGESEMRRLHAAVQSRQETLTQQTDVALARLEGLEMRLESSDTCCGDSLRAQIDDEVQAALNARALAPPRPQLKWASRALQKRVARMHRQQH